LKKNRSTYRYTIVQDLGQDLTKDPRKLSKIYILHPWTRPDKRSPKTQQNIFYTIVQDLGQDLTKDPRKLSKIYFTRPDKRSPKTQQNIYFTPLSKMLVK